jgi:hypothetical protein
MTIDAETLMAYADGELDMISAKRVEKAIAADPALAEQVEKHRQLRAMLSGAFDPIASAPVPGQLEAMIRESAKFTPIETAKKPVIATHWWRNAGAIAAALVVGVMVGQMVRPGSEIAANGSSVMASGTVAKALEGQLAATQGDAPVRMLVSFRNADKQYCRAFETKAQTGIACREAEGWQVRLLRSDGATQKSEFRQAGSLDIIAEAQELAVGEPLDAAGEAAAKAMGWRTQ